jgi:hypothetical protein
MVDPTSPETPQTMTEAHCGDIFGAKAPPPE